MIQAWRSWTSGVYSTWSILRGSFRDTGMEILDRCGAVQYQEHTERPIERHRHEDLGQECVCTVPGAY